MTAKSRFTTGYGTSHPECGADEVFICYEDKNHTADMDLPGKRFGARVFDNNGQELTGSTDAKNVVPVFANRAEHRKRYTSWNNVED